MDRHRLVDHAALLALRPEYDRLHAMATHDFERSLRRAEDSLATMRAITGKNSSSRPTCESGIATRRSSGPASGWPIG